MVMLLVRPWICRKCLPRRSKMSIYAAMYFIPILTIIHALIGGLLCTLKSPQFKHFTKTSIYRLFFSISSGDNFCNFLCGPFCRSNGSKNDVAYKNNIFGFEEYNNLIGTLVSPFLWDYFHYTAYKSSFACIYDLISASSCSFLHLHRQIYRPK